MKFVSIIVPIYNAEKYLEVCIQSILRQSHKNFELILVNDGSQDNSLEICKRLQKEDERIKVFTKENGGASNARNYGMEKATGEYVTFVDSDDIVLPNHLETLVKTMQFADLGIVNFKRKRKKDDYSALVKKYLQKKAKFEGLLEKEEFFKKLFAYPYLGGGVVWNKIFRRDLLDGIRFNEKFKYHEDINFVFLYALKCQTFYYIDKVTYIYILNPTSVTLQKHFSMNRLTGMEVMTENNEIAKKVSPSVYSYSRAWEFLVNIELLFDLKYFKVKDEKALEKVRKNLKETYPYFKKNKKNFNFLRRMGGGIAYKLMKILRF